MELNYTHIYFSLFLLDRENAQKYLYITLLLHQSTQVTTLL